MQRYYALHPNGDWLLIGRYDSWSAANEATEAKGYIYIVSREGLLQMRNQINAIFGQ